VSRLILLLVLLPGLASAQIYRWTDAQGHVHFSQQPVAGATPVEVRPQVIERDQATREREAGAARFFKARRDEQAEAAAREAEARSKRAGHCAKLRAQLAELGRGRLFFSTSEQGERKYYSDGEVAAARSRLEASIRENCS
jgi:hypothetical protein